MSENKILDTMWDDNPIDITQEANFIWSIANKFNTTVANLKSLNNLSSNLLQIGQKLKISAFIAKHYFIFLSPFMLIIFFCLCFYVF